MNYVRIDAAAPGVTQPLVSNGRPWLCRDSTGVLHATYNKWFNAGATWRPMHGYSSDNGASWLTEELGGAPVGAGAYAQDPAIIVDSADVLHVFYEHRATGSTTHILKHAYKIGLIWTLEDVTSWVASSTSAFAFPHCDIDSADIIHITFTRRMAVNNFNLQYIRGTTGAWVAESTIMTSVSDAASPKGICLVFDSADTLHLLYRLSADFTKLRERTGTPPGIENVIETFAAQTFPNMAAAGAPGIAVGAYSFVPYQGYIKRQPVPGAWEAAEAVFTPDVGFGIDAASAFFTNTGKERLVQLDTDLVTEQGKVKIWEKIGGVWTGSAYDIMPVDEDIFNAMPLSHYNPLTFGSRRGLCADGEVLMMFSAYDGAVLFDYIIGFGRTVLATAPTVTIQDSEVLASRATCHATITAGDLPITNHGICYSLLANPTLADAHTSEGATGLGAFESLVTGLTPNTIWHFSAYATNAGGTSYSGDQQVTTLIASVQTDPATGVS